MEDIAVVVVVVLLVFITLLLGTPSGSFKESEVQLNFSWEVLTPQVLVFVTTILVVIAADDVVIAVDSKDFS